MAKLAEHWLIFFVIAIIVITALIIAVEELAYIIMWLWLT